MRYVFDSNAFRVLEDYYPERFPSFWGEFDGAVEAGGILSAEEVLKEINQRSPSDFLLSWVQDNKDIFAPPTEAELDFVAEIFGVEHFQNLVGKKQILQGTPVADPFLIARARDIGGCVVTQERAKENAAKIPNVCAHFAIECVDLEGFMARQGWRF